MKMPLITSPLFSLLPIPRPPTMLMPRDLPGSRKSSTLEGRTATFTSRRQTRRGGANLPEPARRPHSLPGLVPAAVGGALLPLAILPFRQGGNVSAPGTAGEETSLETLRSSSWQRSNVETYFGGGGGAPEKAWPRLGWKLPLYSSRYSAGTYVMLNTSGDTQ